MYKQFYLYIIILIGFMIMSVSFFRANDTNNVIIGIILIPLLYILFKSVYGLILLYEGYKPFHYQLTLEYSLIFMTGYNMILLSYSHHNLVYCLESYIIIIIGYIIKDYLNKSLAALGFSLFMISLLILDKIYLLNIYLVILTLLFNIFVLLPVFFMNKKKIIEEIMIINDGLEKHPDGLIKEYLK